jgi:hypothetical protein
MTHDTTPIPVTKPPEFLLGSPDHPCYSAICIIDNEGVRRVQVSMVMSRSYIMSKEDVYKFGDWMSWATAWMADR